MIRREIIVSLMLAALFAGCATKIEHGSFRFVTYGNASHLAVTGPGIRLEATGLNHSLPTGYSCFSSLPVYTMKPTSYS